MLLDADWPARRAPRPDWSDVYGTHCFLVGQIERVFSAACQQKVWDHFSKAQRKNIELWKKQATVRTTQGRTKVSVTQCLAVVRFVLSHFIHRSRFQC